MRQGNIMDFNSLKNFDEYSDKYYEMLKHRSGFSDLASVIEPFLHQIIAKGDFYIRVRAEVLMLILTSGRFKNALENNGTVTFGGSKTRVESTRLMFNCDKNQMADKDYPRFGYLSCSDRKANFFGTYDMAYQYGTGVIKLKKNNLFDRTTLTVGSSLDFFSSAYLVPTRLKSPRATCIVSFPNPNGLISPLPTSFHSNSLTNLIVLYESIKNGELNIDNFYTIDEILGGKVPLFRYFELQFHGDITTDDIESIDVDFGELDDSLKTECKKLNIDIMEQSL